MKSDGLFAIEIATALLLIIVQERYERKPHNVTRKQNSLAFHMARIPRSKAEDAFLKPLINRMNSKLWLEAAVSQAPEPHPQEDDYWGDENDDCRGGYEEKKSD